MIEQSFGVQLLADQLSRIPLGLGTLNDCVLAAELGIDGTLPLNQT